MVNRFPILIRLVTSAVVTVLFFGACEWALSHYGWSQLYEGDPGYDWRLKSNLDLERVPHVERQGYFSVRTHDHGFRDGPLPTEGPWILALGCSTTFGWGVESEDTWPKMLEDNLGIPVFNAGVPGHSSEQGKHVADKLLESGPTLAILGWGLRDAQKTTIPDVNRRPAAFPRNTAVYEWFSQRLRSPRIQRGTTPRVSADRFQENLEYVVSLATAKRIKILLLDMTGRSETPDHASVLHKVGPPVVIPQLSNSMVFEEDRIHLNAVGNRALAQLLVPAVNAMMQPEQKAVPAEAEPKQIP